MKKKLIKTNSVSKLKEALLRAAEEFYQADIIQTGMKDLEIGKGKTYLNMEDWLESKINEWL